MTAVYEGLVTGSEADDLDRALEEFGRSVAFLEAHHADLLADYPEQWVAVSGEGIEAHAYSMEELVMRLRQHGDRASSFQIEFMTAHPPTLIL